MKYRKTSSDKATCATSQVAPSIKQQHIAHTASATQIKILRVKDVCELTGFSRQWIYELIRREEFPKPSRIGIRAVGWDSRVIESWIINRLQGGEQ